MSEYVCLPTPALPSPRGTGREYHDICKPFCVYQNPDPLYTKSAAYP